MTSPDEDRRTGAVHAVAAYGLWGMLPLYFVTLAPAGSLEILGCRILFSVVVAAILIRWQHGWGRMRTALRDRRVMLTLAAAAALIFVNWLTYITAATSGHVVETSLGYFINPIVTVLLGVVVLRERLRPLQWAAIGVSALAIVVLVVAYGQVPVIALTLAFSFGLYGLLKRQVSGRVDGLSGLAIETILLIPAAGLLIAVVSSWGQLTLLDHGPVHFALLAFSGIATLVPLLFFAGAAKRLPLAHLGLFQYLAPILQLLTGVLILHEPMPATRWIGFAIVWLAVFMLVADVLIVGRRGRA
ncbi:EamA family transporter RarD [Arsenicicoccus piscis]|uniref:Protein RarD n=1 Tax=Arsenicicoccus piscis TaxID=673954 RepID=A0ABQ6HRE0_9MICO|nr:EamA family transporter RarD [Arsenicicoccus piscis]MCH8628835.1 EamA family transporter RarD [Arsenicicoccus piscis]GMA20115.1 protein RarD [Arsenicicoccus piscis]